MKAPGSLHALLDVPPGHAGTPISPADGDFLFTLLTRDRLTRTLETGFALGVSAAYILSATRSPHYAIDPAPEAYDHLGMRNLERLGLHGLVRLQTERSHTALPRLLADGLTLDFGFIDGDHRFDGIFIDFYYLDLMLVPGGYAVFHDLWMPATRRVMQWIGTNKTNYRPVASGVSNLAVVQKIGDDTREWTHFHEFGPASSWDRFWRRVRGRSGRGAAETGS